MTVLYSKPDKNPNTGQILKMVEREGMRFQTVLRVHTSLYKKEYSLLYFQ